MELITWTLMPRDCGLLTPERIVGQERQSLALRILRLPGSR